MQKGYNDASGIKAGSTHLSHPIFFISRHHGKGLHRELKNFLFTVKNFYLKNLKMKNFYYNFTQTLSP